MRTSFLCTGLLLSQLSFAGPVDAGGLNLFSFQVAEKEKRNLAPQVGDIAKDFKLKATDGKSYKLKELSKDKLVVLVVLRGFPGYQCPACTRQAANFLAGINAIKKEGAILVFVYPGPANNLEQKAGEFLADSVLPDGAIMLLDPDYQFTNLYGLRWDAQNETAYPSTFIIDSHLKIRFAKISKTHGGRTSSQQVLSALKALK
ncbi:MAG: redoxin domain-containing protein [Planctomycetaceae bacterium]|nr:redoxin domain-containing protein [Planctomycetaceae bacterium]